MGIKLLADRVDNALARLLQYPCLGNIKDKAQKQHDTVFHGRVHDYVIISVGFKGIHRVTDQNRPVEVNPRQRKHQNQA